MAEQERATMQMNVRIKPSVKRRLKAKATEIGCSLNILVGCWLEERLLQEEATADVQTETDAGTV